jgi:hypothetical protein
LVANSPGLIAGSNVLHRLLVPRHPPIALSSLSHNTTKIDARVHYAVLKIRAGTPTPAHHLPHQIRSRRENPPPATNPSRQLGEGWPQPPHHLAPDPHGSERCGFVTQKNRSQKPCHQGFPARFLRTQQRASTIHPANLAFHTWAPKSFGSTDPVAGACTSNGQCSTVRSTIAPEHSPGKR